MSASADMVKIKPLAQPVDTVAKDAAVLQAKDPAAEVDRLIKLRERIYQTNATLLSTLDSARKNQTFRYYPFRYVCTATDDSEIDFITGEIKDCNGPTRCSVRFAYEKTRGSCQSGKFADLCVSSDMCGSGTLCDVPKQQCVKR
jgi:hypothetical protein